MELFEDRSADVAGMTVRRALPQRAHRTVGAWCFLDHFGPVATGAQQPVAVGPHPHIGLQTVTWLLAGELVHRDSLGSEESIRPGQLNLMSSGRGIAHAEESLDYHGEVHGAQLWVAQPEATRHGAPAFEHHDVLPQTELDNGTVTWLLGGASGARRDTALVGLDLELRAGVSQLELDSTFEHAVVVLEGSLLVGSTVVEPGTLAYLDVGSSSFEVTARENARALLIGGEPMAERVHMWWNFVGRGREEIAMARADWESGSDRFGIVDSDLARIAAPEL